MNEYCCETHLLSDEPAMEDALGPYGRTARMLSEFVMREDGGRSIGFVDSDGSGKSVSLRSLTHRLMPTTAPALARNTTEPPLATHVP